MTAFPRKTNHVLLWMAAATGMAIGAVCAAAPVSAQSGAQATTRDGVYSTAQAERGQMVFDEKCRDCHTAAMWGSDWDGKSVGDVFEYISQYMPEPAPGTLSPRQTRDVVAFLLKSNALPAGSTELPDTLEAMKTIRMMK